MKNSKGKKSADKKKKSDDEAAASIIKQSDVFNEQVPEQSKKSNLDQPKKVKAVNIQEDDSSLNQRIEEREVLVKKQIVEQIEDEILNTQQELEQKVNFALNELYKTIGSTLTNLREKHYYNSYSKDTANEKINFFQEKQFYFKQSVLSEYFRLADYRTLYNIAVAILVMLAFNLMHADFIEKHDFLDMGTFAWCFSKFELIFSPWFQVCFFSFLIVPLVQMIIHYKLPKYIWIPIYSAMIVIMQYIACSTCSANDMGFASSMIVMCEMIRMGMKMHAYLRNKLLYCTNNKYRTFIPQYAIKQGITQKDLINPQIDLRDLTTEFKRFIYFFFCPSLIYRDNYIKSPSCNYRKMIQHFFNFFLCIYFGFVLFKTFCKPYVIHFSQNFSFNGFIQLLFKLMLPSCLSLLLLFFGLLHSWLNGFAELMRFPDRSFYLDWWNSSEFGSYYRKWNIVVHEWLFYYVYGDTARFSLGQVSRQTAQLVTFLISAFIHELILTYVLGFFFPILLIVFIGPGVLLINNTRKLTKASNQVFNIIFWILMFVGTSLIITLYLVEYYARLKVDNSIMNERWGVFAFAIPRSIYLGFL